jgi:hypothetical protein
MSVIGLRAHSNPDGSCLEIIYLIITPKTLFLNKVRFTGTQ